MTRRNLEIGRRKRHLHCVTQHEGRIIEHHEHIPPQHLASTGRHRNCSHTKAEKPSRRTHTSSPSHSSLKTNMGGCVPSRPSPTFYDEYFSPSQHPYKRKYSHRIAEVDKYDPGSEYQDYKQRYEKDIAAERYEDAYEQLTARSKLSKAHGLQAYCEDRGW